MTFKCENCNFESEDSKKFTIENDTQNCNECIKFLKQGFRLVNGTISNLSPRENKYGLQLKETADTWFNGFGSIPGQIRDKIEFWCKDAEVNGRLYHNIKRVNQVNNTHLEPTPADEINYKESEYQSQQPEVNACQGGEETNKSFNSTLANSLDSPTRDEHNQNFKKEFVLLMKASVDICIARGLLSEEEVKANYIRFLKLSNLYENWEKINLIEVKNDEL